MNKEDMQKNLLSWYAEHSRSLPWRRNHPDPYHVWLSEMMLQQTTVATVIPYFQRFLERWPTLMDLAQAQEDEVLHAWQGLGYYSRARNMLKTAQIVANQYKGSFPSSAEALQRLPGIGPYAAAAIAAIAFDQPAAVVDGNILRILSRLTGDATPLPVLKRHVYDSMTAFTPVRHPGDFAQALMDLGALVCRPKKPTCSLCPLQKFCVAYHQGMPEAYPVKAAAKAKPHREAYVFWIENEAREVWVRQRPAQGLLARLWEFPTTPWGGLPCLGETKQAFQKVAWCEEGFLPIRHEFTHFRLTLYPLKGHVLSLGTRFEDGEFLPMSALESRAFPTVMRKVMRGVSRQ